MSSEERAATISSKIWYWFPVRWTDGTDWWEIVSVTVVGNEEDGGVDLLVRKNEVEPTIIHFTNDEMLGDSPVSIDVAKARVMV